MPRSHRPCDQFATYVQPVEQPNRRGSLGSAVAIRNTPAIFWLVLLPRLSSASPFLSVSFFKLQNTVLNDSDLYCPWMYLNNWSRPWIARLLSADPGPLASTCRILIQSHHQSCKAVVLPVKNGRICVIVTADRSGNRRLALRPKIFAQIVRSYNRTIQCDQGSMDGQRDGGAARRMRSYQNAQECSEGCAIACNLIFMAYCWLCMDSLYKLHII